MANHRMHSNGNRVRVPAVAGFVAAVTVFLAGVDASQVSGPRVGVLDYYPMSGGVTQGKRGLFVELLEDIADREGWSPTYVPGSLEQNLARLERGELDLVAAAPFSVAGADRFDFGRETVISTWASVLAREGVEIRSPLDLDSLPVGTVRDDPYNGAVRTMVRSLGLSCEFVEFNDYDAVCAALGKGWVSVAVVDRLYAATHTGENGAHTTPLIFSPVELRYAAPRGGRAQFLSTLDFHVAALKRDSQSRYYAMLDRLLGTARTGGVPGWLVWAGVGVLGLAALFGAMSLLLRHEVHVKTRELTRKNELLEAENTGRRLAEAELRRSNDMLERTFEGMGDALLLTDSRGLHVLHCNDAAARMFGRDRHDLLSAPIESLVASGRRAWPAVQARVQEAVEVRETVSVSLDMQRGEESFPAEVFVSPVRNENDEVPSLVLIVKDHSAHRALRDSERRLRMAQRMEAIGTLAGGIAHDFNNILMPILGYSELIKRHLSTDAETLHHFVDQVLQAAERARDLVAQILAFSRQSEPKRVPMRLTPIVKEALKLLRASLPSTIRIEFVSHTIDDTVMADPTQMHQVVMNLTSNSSHAMRQKGGTLSVSMDDRHELPADVAVGGAVGEHYVCLTLADTGVGMPPELQERVFDPFFTTKGPGEGTGMGLAVVHGIVEGCGGAISLSSTPGEGTTVSVYLPQVKTPRFADTPETPAADLRGRDERVLFVDDEPVIVELFEELLQDLGYRVVSTTSSEHALDVFKAEPDSFDVLVTDQTMPGLTGTELAERLKGIRPGLPVLLCTGYSETVSRDDALSRGISEYVLKPLNRTRLARILRELLDGYTRDQTPHGFPAPDSGREEKATAP